jgi:serine/threonine protein kinase
MSSPVLKETNLFLKREDRLLSQLRDPYALMILNFLNMKGKISEQQIVKGLSLPDKIINLKLKEMVEVGLVCFDSEVYFLNSSTKSKINYKKLDLSYLVGQIFKHDSFKVENPLSHDYEIIEVIGSGATSFTFKAKQKKTHKDRTLKIFFPDTVTYEQLDKALEKRKSIRKEFGLPDINDAGEVNLVLSNNDTVTVPCVVLEYINNGAITFSEFLEKNKNLNPQIFKNFVERVGAVMVQIESVGLIHGDLHEGNILVQPDSENVISNEFYVIDFIGVPSYSSPNLEILSDLENFKNHLLKAAIIVCENNPNVSARVLLGEKVFNLLQKLRDGEYVSFKEMLEDYAKPIESVPSNYFNDPLPQPFEWLRVETIPSAEWLFKLFEPINFKYETISRFGNTWISGPRGCGKSHYIRILAFYPEIIRRASKDPKLEEKLKKLNYDFKKNFGVLFACRLGEFKGFDPAAMDNEKFDFKTIKFLKHILVLKIFNKTLQTIKEGVECFDDQLKPILRLPSKFDLLNDFLESKFDKISLIEDTEIINTFLQYIDVLIAKENSANSIWHIPTLRSKGKLLDEIDLDEFFKVVKGTFPDLKDTRFHILVDDASHGHIHFEMQKILNSLVRSVQGDHCFKITCEKFMYTLDTSDGRAIDPRHEVTYEDLGEVSTKSQKDMIVNMSSYMARVINTRLKEAGFNNKIEKILGHSQDPNTFLSALSLPKKRKNSKTANEPAYYAGWNIIFHLAHGSVRTLLEMIEYIFTTKNVTPEVEEIDLKSQDKAIRSYSSRQFKALSMLPGEIDGEPIGKRAQAVVSAIGEISRQYLEKYNTGDPDRWYETISIERLDGLPLAKDAKKLLNELIKFGLLLNEGLTFSRAQFGLQDRYDLNKVFSPAFRITYRVRNHIYLSKSKLNNLFISPDKFVKEHKNKLKSLLSKAKGQQEIKFEK